MPTIGEDKARRIAEFSRLLLPPETAATTAPLQAPLQQLDTNSVRADHGRSVTTFE